MSIVKDFALPDLGEGLTESEIVSWQVAEGDTVSLNQVIAEVETAKALVELPSPFAGRIARLYAEPGTTVRVGTPIVAFELEGAPDAPADQGGDVAASAAPAEAGTDADAPAGAAAGRTAVLVGYGPKVETGERPARRPRTLSAASAGAAQVTRNTPVERPRSTPPVRKLARDLGVDLAEVQGTGERGLITREDVEGRASGSATGIEASADRADQRERRDVRIPVTGVRKRTAEAMVASAFTAPHATEFLTVDVTPTMELIASLKRTRDFRERPLGILTLVAKALCIAVKRTPEVNAHWDADANEILQYGAVNLGIAADTPRGLLVPNIPNADQLALTALADELTDLTTMARAGRTPPARLSGGTITITNVGVFGVDAGTPILNPGEAAILAMGAVSRRPWEYRGEIALRDVMTLSLSFDHRMVDGAQGSRFLADVGALLAQPGMALTML